MPWREHLSAEELQLIGHPDARAHHLGHERLASVLQMVIGQAISKASPSLGRTPGAVLHAISKDDHPLNDYYKWSRAYIVSVVASIDQRAGGPAIGASDWIDHHAAELVRVLRTRIDR